MPIHILKCSVCDEKVRSLSKDRDHCGKHMVPVIASPEAIFKEPRDKEHGKSVLKDMNKIVYKRFKDHARDNELHDLIQQNPGEASKVRGWLNEHGTIRKKIDDL